MNELAALFFSRLLRVHGVMALVAIAIVSTAFSGNISKTFEFGPGTDAPRSHLRTFNIPCRLQVGVVVKFQRTGQVNASNDIPIIIEVHEPDLVEGQENSVYYEESAMAQLTEQTVTLRIPGKPRGCSLPWRVRVRCVNQGASPFRVSGSIRIDFDDRAKNIDFENVGIVAIGRTKLVKTDAYGIAQGKIEITGTWYHFIGGIQFVGPNPIRLEIGLVNPNGTVVKTVRAYSSDEARSELTKFKLTHQITDCISGKWTLSVTNPTNDDANFRSLTATFTPSCSN